MKDEILGDLSPDPKQEGVLIGEFEFEERMLPLRIDSDGMAIDECISLARTACSSLVEIDRKARRAAAAEFLESYNDGWRHYTKANDLGESIEVSEPELSEDGFVGRLRLTSVGITGNENCCLGYDCGTLFWGHSIFVDFLDGFSFEEPYAQLFG